MEKVDKKTLRTGFTTGTSATAASKAAILSIINQSKFQNIEVKLPKGKYIVIPIHFCEFGKEKARCSVIKDGGDIGKIGGSLMIPASISAGIHHSSSRPINQTVLFC